MKKIFRWLIAEFDGFYLSALSHFMNNTIYDIMTEISYFSRMAFKLDYEVEDGEALIRLEDLYGIGKIAGFFTPFISAETNRGSIRFTSFNIVEGVEYSERGLLNKLSEAFEFYRTDEAIYTDDITSLATDTLQASFVPHGTPIEGWLVEGVEIIAEDGTIITENILPPDATLPIDKAYYPYYGEKYLYLAEVYLMQSYLEPGVYKILFESFQRIRYNGTSIKEFLIITKAILGNYIYDVSFIEHNTYREIKYYLNPESAVIEKFKKLFVWKFLVESKFKQFILTEVIDE